MERVECPFDCWRYKRIFRIIITIVHLLLALTELANLQLTLSCFWCTSLVFRSKTEVAHTLRFISFMYIYAQRLLHLLYKLQTYEFRCCYNRFRVLTLSSIISLQRFLNYKNVKLFIRKSYFFELRRRIFEFGKKCKTFMKTEEQKVDINITIATFKMYKS